jgi:hypothetical protein
LAAWKIAARQIIGSFTARRSTSGYQAMECFIKSLSISASSPREAFETNTYVEDWSSPVMFLAHFARLLLSSIKPNSYKHPCLSPGGMLNQKSIVK